MNKYLLSFWILGAVLLFLYSFTQVDLSLTLSSASIFQTIQKGFQYVGWFNRPLSTYLYVTLFTFLFLIYLWTLKLISQKKLSAKTLWSTILIVTGILMLSYNAFSYDLFNYIFDARIVSFYHKNPYLHKALDFPGDPMLSFMHWTHRTYPYGPLWLVLTVPITFIAENIFILTFYLFKLLIASFFILTVWSLGKVGSVLKLSNVLLPVAAFALNPFILMESLVSAHNDIVMMGIAIFGTYYLLRNDKIKGSVFFTISAGIKFATAILIIGYFVLLGFKKTQYFIVLSIILMTLGVIVATLRTTFQPWYLIYVFPFAALYFRKTYVKIPLIGVSIGAVAYYIPYLYTGNWDPPIPVILNGIIITSLALSVFTTLVVVFLKKKTV